MPGKEHNVLNISSMNCDKLSDSIMLGIPYGNIQWFKMTATTNGAVVFDIGMDLVSLLYLWVIKIK